MAFLFHKFQEAVKTLARSPTFSKDPRQLQFEADINRLFLYTSYIRLGKNADEADAEEIIDMASKSSVADQQKQVQENIHSQIMAFCMSMNEILCPGVKNLDKPLESSQQLNTSPRRSGLTFAVGGGNPRTSTSDVPETRPLNKAEVSQRLKDLIGLYTKYQAISDTTPRGWPRLIFRW
ncbi:SET domain-containing protein 9 [Quillaja saponaria]|uniref:SET domain-containing protein 9 n=1 Tax=Quillaja saponaria TaxID=32244 RepID=A0AAD7P572_QUISA|nr:SET domain-containing protein 9 [Quillaja saponaria]